MFSCNSNKESCSISTFAYISMCSLAEIQQSFLRHTSWSSHSVNSEISRLILCHFTTLHMTTNACVYLFKQPGGCGYLHQTVRSVSKVKAVTHLTFFQHTHRDPFIDVSGSKEGGKCAFDVGLCMMEWAPERRGDWAETDIRPVGGCGRAISPHCRDGYINHVWWCHQRKREIDGGG